MDSQIRKSLQEWHKKIGLWSALVFALLCVSAVPALFVDELRSELLGALVPAHELTASEWLQQATQELSLQERTTRIFLDETHTPLALTIEDDHERASYYRNASGAFVPLPALEVINTLAYFHYSLLIPKPLGDVLVGLGGIFVLFLGLAGFLLYPNIWRDKFKLRWQGNLRVMFSDLHKFIGLWLIPFNLILAFSGAVFGLKLFLVLIGAFGAYQGDEHAAIHAVLGPQAEREELVCDMVPLETLMSQGESRWRDQYGAAILRDVQASFYSDCGAMIKVNHVIPGSLTLYNTLTFSGRTGEEIWVDDWLAADGGSQTFAALGVLHYGNIFGHASRLFYALVAVALTVMVVSGCMLWASKKGKAASFMESRYVRVLVGSVFGAAASVWICLAVATLRPGFSEHYWSLIFIGILAAVILCAVFMKNLTWLTRILGASVIVPLVFFYAVWPIGMASWAMVLAFMVLAVGLMGLSRQIVSLSSA